MKSKLPDHMTEAEWQRLSTGSRQRLLAYEERLISALQAVDRWLPKSPARKDQIAIASKVRDVLR